ncbi:MAG: ABC transporter permease [Dehalococcoidia bacterium]
MTAFVVRPVAASFRYQLRVNLTTLSSILIFLATPIIFGSVSVLFLNSYNSPELTTRAVLGSGIVAVWTTSLMLSNITLSGERWSGVVEMFLATPSRLGTMMLGKLLANAAQGVMAACLSVTVVSLVTVTTISVEKPLLLGLSAVIATVSVGALAFAWSPMLFISRNATSVFFVLDTSLVFVSAVFFPLSRLPDWLQPISRLSPLRWASEALVTSADANAPASETFEAWAALAILGLVYAGIGLAGFGLLERRLRRTGELSTF